MQTGDFQVVTNSFNLLKKMEGATFFVDFFRKQCWRGDFTGGKVGVWMRRPMGRAGNSQT